jgi:hypothetical protein
MGATTHGGGGGNQTFINFKSKTGELHVGGQRVDAWEGRLTDAKVVVKEYDGNEYNALRIEFMDHEAPETGTYALEMNMKSMTTMFIMNGLLGQERFGIIKLFAWNFDGRTGLTLYNDGKKIDASQNKYKWDKSLGTWAGVPAVERIEKDGEVFISKKKQEQFWLDQVKVLAKKIQGFDADDTPAPAPKSKSLSKAAQRFKDNFDSEDDLELVLEMWPSTAAGINALPNVEERKYLMNYFEETLKKAGFDVELQMDGTYNTGDLPF